MALNTSPLNVVSLNALYGDGTKSETISETLSLSLDLTSKYLKIVLEDLIVNNSRIDKVTYKNTLSNTLRLLDSTTLSFRGVASESLVLSSTSTHILLLLQQITERLIHTSSFSDKVTFSNVISNIISLVDTTLFTLYVDINESFNIIEDSSVLDKITFSNAISEALVYALTLVGDIKNPTLGVIVEALVLENTLDSLHKLYAGVLESLISSNTTSTHYVYLTSLSDNLNLVNTVSNTAELVTLLSENILVTVSEGRHTSSYIGYVFSPETASVTTYSNYDFKCCAKLDGKYLFGNSTGLYEYGDTTDDGSKILVTLQSPILDFGSSNLKQIPSMYLGISSDSVVYLKMSVDGKGSFYYKLNKTTSSFLKTQKIDLGKGLIGRYFQFELMTDTSNLNFDKLEVYPVELRRKL